MKFRRQLLVMSFLGCLPSASWASGTYEQFYKALRLDDAATVTRLLARGFDPNTPDERGEPPLVTALRDGHLAVADVLWKHPDLKIDQPNVSNETPLMMASLRAQHAWVQRLTERGAAVNRPGWTPLMYAASGGDVRTVELLVKAGADLQAPNPSGSSALHMAARFGSDEVALALVQLGLDPRKPNPSGQDAIAAARWAGRERLAEQLERLAAARAGR